MASGALMEMAGGGKPFEEEGDRIDPASDPVLREIAEEYSKLEAAIKENRNGGITVSQGEAFEALEFRFNKRCDELGISLGGSEWNSEQAQDFLQTMEGKIITPGDWKEKLQITNLGVIPPIPERLIEFMSKPCIITKDGRLRSETHIVCFIPSELDGEPFTAKLFRDLVMGKYPEEEYLWVDDSQEENFNRPPILEPQTKGAWVALCTSMPENTKKLTFDDQEPHLTPYYEEGYKTPYVREMLAALVMHALTNNVREFPDTWGFCLDEDSGLRASLGLFDADGVELFFDDATLHIGYMGRALLAEFS